ncbi:MAG: hypothetical protein OEV89_05435 [Desulfobulbaceae bacterium]|nr:hypothetical protein [Desulfobulbaceae bacterium]HIJ90193.1 SAP domain-containing protein [Deltaproteobacteria bacterium]
MQMMEIKKMAKQIGVNSSKMKKTELIRSIQTSEGNNPCFQMAKDHCAQADCLWRKDCLSM